MFPTNSSCQTFTTALAEQRQSIIELEALVKDFADVPTSNKQIAIQEKLNAFTQVHEKFLSEYKKKVQNVIVQWFNDARFFSPNDICEIGEDGMVIFKQNIRANVKKYWPELIKTVNGDVSPITEITSLKNTEVINGELTINLFRDFVAPHLLQVKDIYISFSHGVNFPQLQIADHVQVRFSGNVVFSLLSDIKNKLMVAVTDRGWLAEPLHFRDVFPTLRKIGKEGDLSVSVSNRELRNEIKNDIYLSVDGDVVLDKEI